MEQFQASPAILDAAAAFHFYASQDGFDPRPDPPQWSPLIGAAGVGAAAALERKGREAGSALVEELDRRFAALTVAVRRAAAVMLPGPTGSTNWQVTYCQWISMAAGSDAVPLAGRLRRHCIGQRDAFVRVLVDRLAELAVIPDLQATDSTSGRNAGNPAVGGDLVLSQAALPGEALSPMPYPPLAAAFDARLQARFEEARPRLEAQLKQALALRDTSDVVLPPATACGALLGPYAGPLARLPVAAGVANALSRACLPEAGRQIPSAVERIRHEVLAGFDDELARVRAAAADASRIARTPEASCAAKLAPHFPVPVPHYDANAWPFAGLDAEQSTVLRQGCVVAASKVLRAVMDKHFAWALAQSVPDPDTLAAWTAHGWYAMPPGGTEWIGAGDNPMT